MKTPIHGAINAPFNSLVHDTIYRHGVAWAARYYRSRGVPLWEMLVWVHSAHNSMR